MSGCVVYGCGKPVVTVLHRLALEPRDVPWPCCADHRGDVAALLGTVNPAKESL